MRGSPERARRTRQVVLLSLVGLFVALSVAVTAGAQDGRATASPAPTPAAGGVTVPGSTLVHDSSLTVNRSVVGAGNGEPSKFTLTGGAAAATFSLGDGQSSTQPTNSSNTYTLVESTPTDFVAVVSGAGCPQLGRPFTLRAGQNLSCTVLDVARAGYAIVRIHTETRPDKDPSVFSFDAALALGATPTSVPFTLSDGQTSLDLPVPVGGPSSAVIETVPAGWSVSVAGSDPLCAPLGQSDDRRGVNVSPPAGAAGTVINCTFTNTLPATINLTKVTRPTPVSTRFPFTATGVEPQKFTLANGETRSFADLSADRPYTFTESVPIGWFLTVSGDSACVQSGNTLTVSPTPGQVVNCLLTNSNLDLTSISVNKVTVPAGAAQLFDFTASGPLGDSLHFQLADGGTRSLTGITTLLPYTITEAPVPGWRLSTSGSPNCVPIANGVRITPIPFVAVNCTFTNTRLGSIVIDKTAIGGNATFGFTAPAPLGSRSITTTGSPGTGKETYPDVAPGTYKITETPLAGWAAGTFSGPGCAADGTVTLAAAQTVTCSITNTKLASISIDKNTVPSGDPTSFGFTTRGLSPAAFELTDASAPQTFTDLIPDTTYTIAETPVAGWSLDVKGSGCTFNAVANTVSVTPKPGQAVACVLTNTKLGSITVDKTSVGGDATFGFTEATLGPKSVTTTAGAGTVTYSDVPVGTYDLDETALAGWTSGSFGGDCGADGTITVGIDQDLTCSITNTARATIVIDKVTDPSGDPTSFDFTATGVTPTSFALTDAAPPRSFADLAPGRSYTFTEATPPGWALTVSGDAGCIYDAATGTVTVTPAAGAVVNCVFTNTNTTPSRRRSRSSSTRSAAIHRRRSCSGSAAPRCPRPCHNSGRHCFGSGDGGVDGGCAADQRRAADQRGRRPVRRVGAGGGGHRPGHPIRRSRCLHHGRAPEVRLGQRHRQLRPAHPGSGSPQGHRRDTGHVRSDRHQVGLA